MALAMITACSTDTSLPDVPHTPVALRLVLGTASTSVDTRAAWNDPNAADGEMMKTAYVVMVNNTSRQVTHIVPVIPSATESEQEVVKYITTESGAYSFYSFGNVAPTAIKKSTTQTAAVSDNDELQSITIEGQTFTVGATAPTAEALAAATATTAYNNYTAPATGLPMSNSETYNVSADTTIVLQLYRRMGKMRFTLRNAMGTGVSVSGITLDGVTADNTPQYLFPRKLANGVPTAVFDGIGAHTTATFSPYAPGDDAPLALAADASQTLPDVYVNESLTPHATNTFPLTIRLKRDGDTDFLDRHALLNLTEFPRNTLISVPLALTDYDVSFRAWLYPPIGGYPSVTIQRNDDEFYATFSGEGDIMLTAQIYSLADRNAPEKWFTLQDTSRVTITDFRVTDATPIFTTAPHIDATTGEILGTLSGASGTASLRLTLQIRVNDAQTQVYNRTVYFVVK